MLEVLLNPDHGSQDHDSEHGSDGYLPIIPEPPPSFVFPDSGAERRVRSSGS